jgi:hypothetical protein
VQYISKNLKKFWLLLGLSVLAVTAGLHVPSASAQNQDAAQKPVTSKPRSKAVSTKPANQIATADSGAPSVTGTIKPARASGGTPYFIEFRSRHAVSYGHTYAVHGRVGQKITPKDVVGLHPATESSIPWMIGHLIPVISETGASDGDADEQYVSARYRVLLTKAEYTKLLAFIEQLRGKSTLWHAALYNCNAFVGDIAHYVGLEAPSPFLYPQEYITTMRSLNKGQQRVASSAPLYSPNP